MPPPTLAEQESLINCLAAENASRNASFATLLVALPLLSAIPYVHALLHRSTSLLALLALSSLLSTAFLLRRQHPAVTGIAPLDAWSRKQDVRRAATGDAARLLRLRDQLLRGTRRRVAALSTAPSLPVGPPSPLEAYLPYLNVLLTLTLAILGAVVGDAWKGWIGLGSLPGWVYVAVLAAKVIMGSVDPERELSSLRYEYKGA